MELKKLMKNFYNEQFIKLRYLNNINEKFFNKRNKRCYYLFIPIE